MAADAVVRQDQNTFELMISFGQEINQILLYFRQWFKMYEHEGNIIKRKMIISLLFREHTLFHKVPLNGVIRKSLNNKNH